MQCLSLHPSATSSPESNPAPVAANASEPDTQPFDSVLNAQLAQQEQAEETIEMKEKRDDANSLPDAVTRHFSTWFYTSTADMPRDANPPPSEKIADGTMGDTASILTLTSSAWITRPLETLDDAQPATISGEIAQTSSPRTPSETHSLIWAAQRAPHALLPDTPPPATSPSSETGQTQSASIPPSSTTDIMFTTELGQGKISTQENNAATEKLIPPKVMLDLQEALPSRAELPAPSTPAPPPVAGPLFTGERVANISSAIAHLPQPAMAHMPSLNSRGWNEALGQQVLWMVGTNLQAAELHLNPPDLGPLQVVLNVNQHTADALFMSPHAAVRDALENALPKLREILAEAGISLGNSQVSDQAPQDTRDQAAQKEFEKTHPARTLSTAHAEANDKLISAHSRHSRAVSSLSQIDTFA